MARAASRTGSHPGGLAPSAASGAPSRAPAPADSGRVRVWDAAVRLLHWSLAALVVVNLVRDDGDWLHRCLGYVALGVVAARLLWAALRGGTAGFAELKPSVRGTLAYVAAAWRGSAPRHLGHNPLGRWMVWLLWTLVMLLALTGWISRTDALWGEDWPIDLHGWLADALWISVVLHLAGMALTSVLQRENLPLAMLTGRKRAPRGEGGTEAP